MKDSNKGLASNPILHKFISAKGGKRRVPKGLAKLSPERRREISAMGGRAKYENRRKNAEKQTASDSRRLQDMVEEIRGALDEQ